MSLLKQFISHHIDKQTIFNHVYHSVSIQGQPAQGSVNGSCVLFDPVTNCKCSLGHLLSDEDLQTIYSKQHGYAVGVNGICMHLGLEMGFLHNNTWNDTHDFLNELRMAHDRNALMPYFVDAFKTEMRNIAEKHQLKVPTN